MAKKILLADDSITIQKVIGLTFANEDIELTVVDNGDDALVKAREIIPDLIIADVVMPGRDGYEVCYSTKRDPALQHVPVLLLTGTFETFDEAMATKVQADGYITKPFESQALIDKVEELISAAAARQNASVVEAGVGADAHAAAELEPLETLDDFEAIEPNEELEPLEPTDLGDGDMDFGSENLDAAEETSFADIALDDESSDAELQAGSDFVEVGNTDSDFGELNDELDAAEVTDSGFGGEVEEFTEASAAIASEPSFEEEAAPHAATDADQVDGDWNINSLNDYMADGSNELQATGANEEPAESAQVLEAGAVAVGFDAGADTEASLETDMFGSADAVAYGDEGAEALSDVGSDDLFDAAEEAGEDSGEDTLADDFEASDLAMIDDLAVSNEEIGFGDEETESDAPTFEDSPVGDVEPAQTAEYDDLPASVETEPVEETDELVADASAADIFGSADDDFAEEVREPQVEESAPATEPAAASSADEDEDFARFQAAMEDDSPAVVDSAEDADDFQDDALTDEPLADGASMVEAEPEAPAAAVEEQAYADGDHRSAPAPAAVESVVRLDTQAAIQEIGAALEATVQGQVAQLPSMLEAQLNQVFSSETLLAELGKRIEALVHEKVAAVINEQAPLLVEQVLREALSQVAERVLNETVSRLRNG